MVAGSLLAGLFYSPGAGRADLLGEMQYGSFWSTLGSTFGASVAHPFRYSASAAGSLVGLGGYYRQTNAAYQQYYDGIVDYQGSNATAFAMVTAGEILPVGTARRAFHGSDWDGRELDGMERVTNGFAFVGQAAAMGAGGVARSGSNPAVVRSAGGWRFTANAQRMDVLSAQGRILTSRWVAGPERGRPGIPGTSLAVRPISGGADGNLPLAEAWRARVGETMRGGLGRQAARAAESARHGSADHLLQPSAIPWLAGRLSSRGTSQSSSAYHVLPAEHCQRGDLTLGLIVRGPMAMDVLAEVALAKVNITDIMSLVGVGKLPAGFASAAECWCAFEAAGQVVEITRHYEGTFSQGMPAGHPWTDAVKAVGITPSSVQCIITPSGDPILIDAAKLSPAEVGPAARLYAP